MAILRREQCTAFVGASKIAEGTPREVKAELKRRRSQGERLDRLQIFDDETGEDFDLEGDPKFESGFVAEAAPDGLDSEAVKAAAPVAVGRVGRPKMGVVPREVTLLPRHWEWLESQPGGTSVALRKLVETARKENAPEDRIRRSIEATYRYLSVMCGDLPDFEESARALFKRDWAEFDQQIGGNSPDIRAYLRKLSANARPEVEAAV